MSQPHHPAYRPDIDGLRAVAVLSVLVFHAFPSKLTGGFVGVDIFFVISGYLISTILMSSIGADRFSFADFYGRRARRIFPALAIVLASCLVAGWFILLPTDFAQLGRHVAAGVGFVSNFVLWGESSYFERTSDFKILLHLWSLAIEEQFYIVWPILLLLAHRLRLGFGRMLLVCAAASFVFGLWMIQSDTVAAFIILAGQQSTFNRLVLGNPIMVAVGLISYPLYLWHWPLLAFPRIIEGGTPSIYIRGGALLVSFVLAALTYLVLEKRLRAGRHLSAKALGLGGAMLLCACAGITIHLGAGLPQRVAIAPYLNVDQMLKASAKWDYAENSTCLNRYPTSYRKEGWWFCVMNKDAAPTMMIMGNSFANHLYPGIANNPAFRDQVVLQFGTCDPAMGVTFSPYPNGHPCQGAGRVKQEELSNQIVTSTPSLKVVLLSAPWPFFNDKGESVSYFDENKVDGAYAPVSGAAPSSYAAFMAGMERRVAFLIAHGVTPVIMLGTPELGYPPYTCYSGQPLRQSEETCVVPRSYENRIQERFRAGVAEIQARHPQLKVFDPLPALCSDSTCNLKGEHGPLLRDQGHLSLAGSMVVGDAFARWAKVHLPALASN